MYDYLKNVAESMGIPVKQQRLKSGTAGVAAGRKIVIVDPRLSPGVKVTVVLHEIAHVMLQDDPYLTRNYMGYEECICSLFALRMMGTFMGAVGGEIYNLQDRGKWETRSEHQKLGIIRKVSTLVEEFTRSSGIPDVIAL